MHVRVLLCARVCGWACACVHVRARTFMRRQQRGRASGAAQRRGAHATSLTERGSSQERHATSLTKRGSPQEWGMPPLSQRGAAHGRGACHLPHKSTTVGHRKPPRPLVRGPSPLHAHWRAAGRGEARRLPGEVRHAAATVRGLQAAPRAWRLGPPALLPAALLGAGDITLMGSGGRPRKSTAI